MSRADKKAFLYMDVYETIKQSIIAQELKGEQKLSSEDEMALQYHVSRITVKKALELLKADGYIDRVQGRGTFVRSDWPRNFERRESILPKRKLIGLLLEHVASPFGLDVLYKLDQLLNEAGYTLLIRFSYGSVDKESEEINALLSLGIQALITMPCQNSYYNMTILKLILDQFPVVLMDKRMYGLPVPSVCTDGKAAIQRLVAHLQDCGCKNAALVTIDPSSTTSLSDRVNGFYQGLHETGITCAGECVLPKRTENLLSEAQEPAYLAHMERFLHSFEKMPDAIVLTEYALARFLYIVAAKQGMQPGKEFMACCIDEDYLSPGGYVYTHMRQDENTIAERLVEILLKLIAGEAVSLEPVWVPAIFRLGATTSVR
ncbi:MAG: GntR family transcriptional regulator [Clostridia bacterium]